MVAKRLSVACALVLGLSVPLIAAASGDLSGNLEAFRVVKTDEGKEQFLPADKASPKDVIEYRLTYRNVGDDAIQNIHITDPIPRGMEYVALSATAPDLGAVEFSIDDGKTFHTWPIKITTKAEDGTEKVTEATPDMVSHIRWVLSDSFEPKGKVTVSYRTLIK